MQGRLVAKRAFLHFVCALLLLVAQHGALTHAIWHAQDNLAAHQQHDQDSNHDPDEHSRQSQLCGFDLAFGQVLGAASGEAVVLAVPPLATERVGGSPGSCNYVTSFLPQSRGPPVLL